MAITFPVRLGTIESYLRLVHGDRRELVADELLILSTYADQIVNEIADAWPVETGYSRDLWTFEIRDDPGFLGFVIDNGAYYVQYVHEAGGSAEHPLYETLIPAAISAIAPAMLAALRAEIDVTERRLRAPPATGRGFLDIVSTLRRSRAA